MLGVMENYFYSERSESLWLCTGILSASGLVSYHIAGVCIYLNTLRTRTYQRVEKNFEDEKISLTHRSEIEDLWNGTQWR